MLPVFEGREEGGDSGGVGGVNGEGCAQEEELLVVFGLNGLDGFVGSGIGEPAPCEGGEGWQGWEESLKEGFEEVQVMGGELTG